MANIYKALSNLSDIRLGLKSGFSFNQAKEHSTSRFKGAANSSANNIPFYVEISRPFSHKLSWTIAGAFMPGHNVRSVAEEYDNDQHATYYLNTRVTSYGILGGLNYELYKYKKVCQYITIGTGVMVNMADNSEINDKLSW